MTTSNQPSTPAAEWRVKGQPDPHGTSYDHERAKLMMGNLTDDELANAAFMNYDVRPSLQDIINGKAFSPIAYMTAVKDRIRWLSRKLEEAIKPKQPEPPVDEIIGRFCYSLDGEGFSGKYLHRDSAENQAKADVDDEHEFGEETTYWTGECRHPLDMIGGQKRELWMGERIVEQIDEWCGDEISAEDWIVDLSKEDAKKLGKLVLDFVRTNASFQYYGIGDVTEHPYIAGSSDFMLEIVEHVRGELNRYIAGIKGPWCCEKGQTTGKQVCDECAEISAGYQAAMGLSPEERAKREGSAA